MILGLVVVDVINPNAAPEVTLLIGPPKFGVLVRLKNSLLNWSELQSRMGNVRLSARSIFLWAGPRRMPTPQLPKPVPSPIAGAEVKAAVLRYPLIRVYSDPDVAGLKPVHSARENPDRLPNTLPALLSVTVTGVPD